MRKVSDFYTNKAKKNKYPARSVYKLEEIQKKYRILKRGDSVLDLGCYPGSWSLYASEVVGPKGVVVGVDLQEADKPARPDGAPIHWLQQDIMEEELLTRVRKIRPSFRVIVSDLAPKTTGNRWADHQKSIGLVRMTLGLAEILLNKNGNYVCKVFQGEDYPTFFNEVKARFQMVKTVKPDSSRKESREVFLVAMGFKK